MELILGAILGVVFAVIFQPPLEHVRSFFTKHARRMVYSLRQPADIPNIEEFTLANRILPFLVVDGDGEHFYTPLTLSCVVEPAPIKFPPEIDALRSQIEIREENKRLVAEPYHWNGPLFSLKSFSIGRTIPNEDLELRLVFQKTDYYSFQATIQSLDLLLSDGTTLRKKYLTPPPHDPVPFLATGFGVAIVLVSSDHKIIFSRRSSQSGTRPGELDVSFVEGVHPDLDRAPNSCPDIFRTAIRGAGEEVGVDLAEDDILFFGFGVDLEYYQWNILGMAHLNLPADEALQQRTRGSGGKWETHEFLIIDARPDDVWKFMKHEKVWAMGWVALYWTLVHEYGRSKVDRSARRFLSN